MTHRALRIVSCLSVALVVLLADARGEEARKKIVFVAGPDSHGYGAHEHSGGCRVLAKSLEESGLPVETVVHTGGWPEDPAIFEGAATVVIYCDGGRGHVINRHQDLFEKLAAKGVGLACLHYAVEVEKGSKEEGKSGNNFLDWIGGYFEMHWSVNPHWTAKFEKFPEHPVTRGVKPFEINDEWYYNMRFREGMEGVTPVLTAVPPDETRMRPFGPHSGNEYVRSRLGQPEHVGWTYQRPDGGRGFGFTGGHVHWNWGNDDFRKLVLNAIAWTAHLEIPEGGVPSKTPTREELEKAIGREAPAPRQPTRKVDASKAIYKSPVVTPRTPGHAVDIDVDIRGAKQLWLVVTDGGNGFGCDWADWMEPRLIDAEGRSLRLTELSWKSASSDWGKPTKNRNASGAEMRVAGFPVEWGIGTHANSIIRFDLPKPFERFKGRAGLDNGGTDQGACGDSSSVQFLLFTQEPPASVARPTPPQPPNDGDRDPQTAVASLEIHPDLEATLFASEPMILSPTNLDIDERGRVWVCEVVNYRGHNGKRPEGDRILILEDLDGDGKADESKVFYQGRDIDSAMGICVLGNRVIVSAAPWVFVFHDDDGDDRPDRKEVLFSKTGQPQHDHSNHSFVFGPDGKLYWNFGNTGQHVHDRDGKIVVDRAGNEVRDNGKPYYGGMVFRCNLDGSDFEVLGHNFRNNYEATVDSFGAVWQSDNDDDGNRGVRINYVMEFGNYGYRDELTGRGWRDRRTNMETEVPLQHWHLNDPGVVPNLLQTGGGSPTGITVYEGALLPEVFRGQVIHCDAGPNVVRAYPVKPDGAGYEAETVNLAVGARDRWFRPADVCVAPDGSLFVTDWYDPGVGGHGMGDLGRGRIFRLTPKGKGSSYQVPKTDVSTLEGAVAALKSPSYAVRYLAWTALHEKGAEAAPALEGLWRSDDGRHRARALWLLGKIEGEEQKWVDAAIADADADIRATGVRLARQNGVDVGAVVGKLVDDPSAAVRRECLIALRPFQGPDAGDLWARLAAHHDGEDRWYLEAIGIAADGKWDEWLASWMGHVGKEGFHSRAGRDVLWRSRARVSPAILASVLMIEEVPEEELPRYLRAFDYWDGDLEQRALASLAKGHLKGSPSAKAFVAYEAMSRLESPSLDDPELRRSLNAALGELEGSDAFVELVEKFRLEEQYPKLVDIAAAGGESETGVRAARALLSRGANDLILGALRDPSPKRGPTLAVALGSTGDGRAIELLVAALGSDEVPPETRREATTALTRSQGGARRLLALAREGELDRSLQFAAAVGLARARWGDIRAEAETLLPMPPAKNDKPLPPISRLVSMRGDAGKGEKVFATTGTCANCHKVGDTGKEVGPPLTEIGSKLTRESLLESILFPSASISHSYETWTLVKQSGETLNGVLQSESADEVVIKDANAIVHRVPRAEALVWKKSDVSLMPADLQKAMTVEDLTDVVEYLLTLRKS